jgi:signal transduction histidine kinase
VRRYVEVSLDRRRTYSVAAGPFADGGQGPETAVLVSEISDAFSAGPKEGEAIRQLGHDLRTPLTSMGGAVELLQTGRLGRLSPEQARLLGMLRQGLDLMLSLIDEATLPYRRAAGVAGPRRGTGGGGGATS